MKKIFLITFFGIALLAKSSLQIYMAPNSDLKITPKTIEKAFNSVGLDVAGNNNMNKPFKKRFGKTHYKVYNLAMFQNNEYILKLIKKYPKIGLITPMTMSIWQKDGNIYVSTLSLFGMGRITQIPLDNKELVKYHQLVNKALKKAMPNGKFVELPYSDKDLDKSFEVYFKSKIESDGKSLEDFKDEFEEEFEAEMESLGFLFPNFTNVKEEILDEANIDIYDFYDTYSICKFDVIFPVSKNHPEVGAFAPCSFYIYKKKGEDVMHMGFPGVENWISTTNMKDKESLKPLLKAQGMIKNILNSMIE